MFTTKLFSFLTVFILSLSLSALSACGSDDDDPDDAHLMFKTAPSKALTAGEAVDVSWMIHTNGELHHTEIRACMGHKSDCGLGGMDSFDAKFAATKNGEEYKSSVKIDAAGAWTIVVFAHVGDTPHISDAIHATVN